MIQVYNDVLPDPMAYRDEALRQTFGDVRTSPDVVFHGIGTVVPATVPDWLFARHPTLQPTLSFFRQSPLWQQEPNYIHTDRDMGDWTAILYLNPNPPPNDGTAFFRHKPTGSTHSTSSTEAEFLEEWQYWRDPEQWEIWYQVEGAFNRLVLFSAELFHARGLPDNYGTGEDARLIQLIFGTGAWSCV